MSAETLPADRSPEDLAELLAHLEQIESWIAPIQDEDRTCPGDADDDLYRARVALQAYARDVDFLAETAWRLAQRVEVMQVSCDVLAEVGALGLIAERERDLLAATARRLAGERDAALACGTGGESRTEGEDTDAAVRDARLAEQGQRRLPRVKHRGPAPDVPTAAAPARTGEAGRA